MEDNKKDRIIDLSFYKPNVLAYKLVLLATVLELVYLILMLAKMELNYLIGIFILVNICFLLLLFTIALELKVYKKRASILSVIFGGYAITRFLTVPLVLNVTSDSVLIHIITGVIAALMIFSGIMSFKKVQDQIQYKKDGKINTIQVSK